MPECYEICGCACRDNELTLFDEIISRETRLDIRLQHVFRSNLQLYLDKSTGSTLAEDIRDFNMALYVLWHKNGYCSTHDRIHMKALYVGKGAFARRILHHSLNKDTSNELTIYITALFLENRIAKYVEQLLLDLYNFPLNVAENRGVDLLCGHLLQTDVD